MENRKRKEAAFSIGVLLVNLVFYLFFAVWDGALLSPDSQGYINMEMQREPFYPIFLALQRLLFGRLGESWLFLAVLIQSVLTAVATWSLVNYLHKEMQLKGILSGMLAAICLAVSLLCRFGARRGAMYSNSIETEGICIPLFLLFFRYLLEYTLHQRKKALFFAGIVSFILISTRKQMYLTLILIAIAVFYAGIQKKRYGRGILAAFLCTGGIFLSCQLLDMGYNYALRGEPAVHSKDNRFLATMVFYTAEREDAEAIEDLQVREIFEEIYDACERNGYLKHSAGKGWQNRVTHFEDNYDHIQLDTMGRIIQAFVLENHTSGTDYNTVLAEKQIDAITGEIIRAVFPRTCLKMASVFVDNVLSGLLTTVAKQSPIFVFYAVLAYGGYLILLVWNVRKNGMNAVSVLAVLSLISILVNVTVVSAVIFCQSRYTIYNMPLFYISGLLLLGEAWKWIKGREYKHERKPDGTGKTA